MKEGILINPTAEASQAIRKATENNLTWPYAEVCNTLYRHAEVMMERFFSGVPVPGFDAKLPVPIFAVEPMNIKTLAAYRIVPDEYGLLYKISLNERHFEEDADGVKEWEFREWALNETILHELTHHAQQLRGKDPYKPGKRVTHNKEFVDMLEELGVYPTLGHGAHWRPADIDKPFGWLMKEWGIERPHISDEFEPVPKVDWFDWFNGERKGRSTLTKWTCDCGESVRVGKKNWPGATCNACGSQYLMAPLPQVIYEAPK